MPLMELERCPAAASTVPRRRRAALSLVIAGVATAVAGTAMGQAFTVSYLRGQTRKSVTAMRAEAFDPFGWKGMFKDKLQGILGDEEPDTPPTQLDEAMIIEIFNKFDTDKDGVLNIEEFNNLQTATEGPEAVYNADQLKSLLLAVNPDMKEPEKGMPFADYRRLYVERRLKQTYSTDVGRDHVKIFGPGGGVAADGGALAALQAGVAVTVEGLSGAVELNGQSGKIVSPVDAEVAMVGEGRVIVELEADGERVALKPDNVKVKQSTIVD